MRRYAPPLRLPSGRDRVRLAFAFGEERDRFEPVATAGALPEIRGPARFVFKPDRRGDRVAALRTRILMRQIIRYGSSHDASPICLAFADSRTE